MAAALLDAFTECRGRCRSQAHLRDVVVATSKASPSDAFLATLALCGSAYRRSDFGGRSLVHWAAAGGQNDLLDWLIGRLRAGFTERDLESGYTPLHRALLHGQVTAAQILLDYEASLCAGPLDAEGLSPLELLRADMRAGGFSLHAPTELYSCGENGEYNLGHSHPSRRLTPEPVDALRVAGLRPSKVSMSKFHSLILGQGGEALACGHGLGGRLGLGSEAAAFAPRKIVVSAVAPAPIVDLCAARNHSLFVDAKGAAFAVGDNSYRQLGLGPGVREPQLLEPAPMLLPKHRKVTLMGCAGGRFHSVVWSSDAVFACGLNAGQIGLAKEDGAVVPAIKQITLVHHKEVEDWGLCGVATSEAALVLATTKGEVYLLTGWERLRIAARLVNVSAVQVSGGRLKPLPDGGDYGGCREHASLAAHPVRVVVLTAAGHLFHWHEEEKVCRRVLFSGVPRASAFPTRVQLNRRGLLLTLPDGRALRGTFGPLKSAETAKEGGRLRKKSEGPGETKKEFAFSAASFLELSRCQGVALSRVPGVHRAVDAASDPAGANFTFVTQDPVTDLTELPLVRASEISADFGRLLEEANALDTLHDLVVKTEKRRFLLHKFVVFSRCPELRRLVEESGEPSVDGHRTEYAWPEGDSDLLLEQLFAFLYTDAAPMLTPGALWHLQRGLVQEAPDAGKPSARKKKKRKATAAATPGKVRSAAPLRQLVELGKRLALPHLAKKAGTLAWAPLGDDEEESPELGRIALGPNQSRAGLTPRLRFDVAALPALTDIEIEAEDGTLLRAHRCVLAGRLEYFRLMLGGGEWAEGRRSEAPLRLRFPPATLAALLAFAYTDALPAEARKLGRVGESRRSEFPERLCGVLVSADHFLAERLRELAESVLASLVSLRNVAELLEFAGVYNAAQLRATCRQFAALNLPALLEANSLAGLSRESLEEIGAAYRETFHHVESRRLTPLPGRPGIEDIQLLSMTAESLGVDLEDLTELVLQRDKAAGEEKGRRERVKTESESAVPVAQPLPPKEEEWTIVGASKAASPPTPLMRGLRLSESGQAKTPADVSPPLPASAELIESPTTEVHPPYVAPKTKFGSGRKKKIVWAALSDPQTPATDVNANEQPRKGGWLNDSSTALVSLRDVMSAEEKAKPKATLPKPVPVSRPRRSWATPPAASPPAFPGPASPTPVAPGAFSQILAEEERRLSALHKRSSARLDAIQLEEAAMAELLVAYGAHSDGLSAEVCISVQRVPAAAAPSEPSWRVA